MTEISELLESYKLHDKNNSDVSINEIKGLITSIYTKKIFESDLFADMRLKDNKKIQNKVNKINKNAFILGSGSSGLFSAICLSLCIMNYFKFNLFILLFIYSIFIPPMFSFYLGKILVEKTMFKVINPIYESIEKKYKETIKEITISIVEEIDSDNNYSIEIKTKLKKILIDGNYDFENDKKSVLFYQIKKNVMSKLVLNNKVLDQKKIVNDDNKKTDFNLDSEVKLLNQKLEALKT